MEPPLAGEITQVRDALPWVRCASDNVFDIEISISILEDGELNDNKYTISSQAAHKIATLDINHG